MSNTNIDYSKFVYGSRIQHIEEISYRSKVWTDAERQEYDDYLVQAVAVGFDLDTGVQS